jgi:hypothetical protein
LAIGDAYAQAADYRTRVTKTATTDDITIDAQLKAVSHFLDRRCRRKDGFNQSTSVEARTYDIGKRPEAGAAFTPDYLRLWLPDDVATVTGLIVKVDLNGDYDVTDANETLAINTDFWVGPIGAAVGSDPQPYEFLDIKPTSTVFGSWPQQRHAIEITAKFGWPEVPKAIKEAVVTITRQMRDAQESGYTLTLENLDQGISQGREVAMLVNRIEAQYKRAASF